MRSRLALVACVLGACSPFGGSAFECSLDSECSGGTCSSGFCSFPDPACPSGQRFGDRSGPRSGECVGELIRDGGPIDTPDVPGTDVCFGTGLVRPCFASAPMNPVSLTAPINTDTSPLCNADPRNAAWCVIPGTTIGVQGGVVATGARPLVLVATMTIGIQGTLEVASYRGGSIGAGANPVACNAGTAPGTSGGGGGGSFGGQGGNGGGTNNAATAGGISGTTMPAPTTLRGGCAGQNGNGGSPGAGGAGGGAVYLIADSSITVDGSINASGAGGNPGVTGTSGAGGGGSGGFIGIDTPSCTNNGAIFANGGGGAEGSGSTTLGGVGGDPIGGAGGAAGGGLSTNGGDGGAGQGGATTNAGGGNNGTATGGGGGGGGGVGIIRVNRGAIGGGVVSPTPT